MKTQSLSRRSVLLAGAGGLLLPTVSLPKAQKTPRFVALLIGVSQYDHGYTPLLAGKDAARLYDALQKCGYEQCVLVNEIVLRDDFLSRITRIFNGLGEDDTFVFYFAGHGSRRELTDATGAVLRDDQGKPREEEYLLFTDTNPGDFEKTALSLSELEKRMAGCVARRRIFIMDACRNTSVPTAEKAFTFRDQTLTTDYGKFRERIDRLVRTQPKGRTISIEAAVLWSCKPGERSLEPLKPTKDEPGGLFTTRLVRALTQGIPGKPLPTTEELRTYIAGAMPSNLPQPQTPDLLGSGTLSISPNPIIALDPITVTPPPVTVTPPPGDRTPASSGRGVFVSAASKARSAGCPELAAYLEAMQPIPGGTFQMGSNDGDPDEKPVHPVTLSDFWLGRTLVPQELWAEYARVGGGKMPEAPSWGWLPGHPIVKVSWYDCQGFCTWASRVSGVALVLPTEAQWEYAARGGGKDVKWPWGNTFDGSKVWSSVWSSVEPDDVNRTAPVDRVDRVYKIKFANGSEVLDMAGNVFQWCSDWYGPYNSGAQTNPTGASSDSARVLRGGSWVDDRAGNFRCANRILYDNPSNAGGYSFGFRLSSRT